MKSRFSSHSERQDSAAKNLEQALKYLRKAVLDLTDDGARLAFADAIDQDHAEPLGEIAERLRQYARNGW